MSVALTCQTQFWEQLVLCQINSKQNRTAGGHDREIYQVVLWSLFSELHPCFHFFLTFFFLNVVFRVKSIESDDIKFRDKQLSCVMMIL